MCSWALSGSSVGVAGEGLQLTGLLSSQNVRVVHGRLAQYRVDAIIEGKLSVPLRLDERCCDDRRGVMRWGMT
jgi:hypothetical protein